MALRPRTIGQPWNSLLPPVKLFGVTATPLPPTRISAHHRALPFELLLYALESSDPETCKFSQYAVQPRRSLCEFGRPGSPSHGRSEQPVSGRASSSNWTDVRQERLFLVSAQRTGHRKVRKKCLIGILLSLSHGGRFSFFPHAAAF
jgi:hypothetical protein